MGAYDKVLGAAEGNPEFSMARSAFDEYDKLEEPKPEEDVFVDGLIETVEEQIDSIKESLGLPVDSETIIKQDEDGNTEVISDGEKVLDEKEETEGTEEEKTDEPSEDVVQSELDFSDDEVRHRLYL